MDRVVVFSLSAVLAFALAACDSPPPPAPASTAAPTATAAEFPATNALPPGEQELPQPAATAEAPPEVVAAQHVLVAYKGAKRAPKTVTRTKADAKKRAEEVAEKAAKGEDFTALVKEYSDEPGAAERLGNLGKFKHEAMAKPFADAAFALKVSQTSGVVETEFGFHVIKRNQ